MAQPPVSRPAAQPDAEPVLSGSKQGVPAMTAYHAAYLAYDLTKRSAAGSVAGLAGTLADAQVDLNPHQVDAAIFATQNPLSRGAILADEVGLGKTIEAGLLLSQRWAERRRKLLVITPANIRKQWARDSRTSSICRRQFLKQRHSISR